jgi:hypothetical protein
VLELTHVVLFGSPECLFWLLLAAQGSENLQRRVAKSGADRPERAFAERCVRVEDSRGGMRVV